MICRPSVLFKQLRCFTTRNIIKLGEKGMINDIFPNHSAGKITDLCNAGPQCVYAGFDPTARTLHVGNLLVLMNLIHWQRGGHQVIALVGGATGRIGDPSGKSKERDELAVETTKSNVKTISACIDKIFDNHSKYFWKDDRKLLPVRVVDNYDWYKDINVIDFICGTGRNFRMGTMLSRSSVESRLASEAGMSYTEFSYQIFQAYDWYHLYKKFGCKFQIGGSDQMGNIISGHDLISRTCEECVYGLTVPLITSESGDKFGKSAGNAVWLDSGMTSPFELYQFLIRTPDSDVEKLLNLFTFLSPGAASDMAKRHMANPEKRLAQKFLATEVTKLVHGEEGVLMAERATSAMYDSNIETLSQLTGDEVEGIFKGAEVVKLLLQPGITVKQLALTAKCFLTQKDADRIINAGGFYINHSRMSNPNEAIVPGVHILKNYVSLLRVGKKNYWIVRWLK